MKVFIIGLCMYLLTTYPLYLARAYILFWNDHKVVAHNAYHHTPYPFYVHGKTKPPSTRWQRTTCALSLFLHVFTVDVLKAVTSKPPTASALFLAGACLWGGTRPKNRLHVTTISTLFPLYRRRVLNVILHTISLAFFGFLFVCE